MSTEMLWYTINIVIPTIIKLMLFRRIILFVRRLRSINGDSVTAIDDEGGAWNDNDVFGIFIDFTFLDSFLSTTMNSISETMDIIEKINIGIRWSAMVEEEEEDEYIFSKNESAIRNEIIVADRVIAPLISIFFNILLLLLLFL